MKLRKLTAATAAFVLALTAFSGCADNGNNSSSKTESSSKAATESKAEDPFENALYGDIRTEFNENLDLSDYPLTKSEVPADYSLKLEAEDGEFIGAVTALDDDSASGGKFVNGINNDGDEWKITVDVEYSGFYDLVFHARSSDYKVNNVLADGAAIGDLTTDTSGEFQDIPLEFIFLSKGQHTISVTKNWGYVDIDSLELKAAAHPVTEQTYNVTASLSNPNADEHTRMLYKFLCDVYGKYSLSGQFVDGGRESRELAAIEKNTGGKQPAVMGMEMGGYSLSSQANGTQSDTVERVYDWYTYAGGIIQLCWHWTSPEGYYMNEGDHHWWNSFYKENSKIDLDKIMNGEDDEGYEALMKDIDNMSEVLGRLRDAGVPVLWRPLHEASGGWFWWGNCSPESYKKLWNVMFDKMTNEHGLTNLIWVWNGQDKEWYPGDETVDIIGWDIYAGKREDNSQSGRFADMASNYSSEPKLLALTENGCVMDPDKVMNDNARWLFWGTWGDPFTVTGGLVPNDEYTSFELLNKAYNHERVLTLDELPDLKNYPLD